MPIAAARTVAALALAAVAQATPAPSPTAAPPAPTPGSPAPLAFLADWTTPTWLAPLARLDPAVLAAVALAALVLAVVTLVVALVTAARARRMTRHYATLMRGVEGQNLARAVESYVERLNAVERRSSQVGEHGRATSTRLQQAIQHVHLERYSAVDGSDNQQSFSLALLDAAANGVVVTALYTRHGLRVYAKPVARGASPYALSDEEQRAIRRDGGD